MKYKVGDRVILNAKSLGFFVYPPKAIVGTAAVVAKATAGMTGSDLYTVISEITLDSYLLPEACLDPEEAHETSITFHDSAFAPKRVLRDCSFCGAPALALIAHDTGLRCQSETWHYCGHRACVDSVALHTSRLEAGLFDTPETRLTTRAWYLAKLEREKRSR